MKIGVFDSGVGGLTVLKELAKDLAEHDLFYLGDTARVPYGIRSPETIRKYSLENCLFLLEQGAEMIVVACNTATANALPFLQSVLKVPVLGVIEPGVANAQAATKTKRIGVIATEATIRSGEYQRRLESAIENVKIFSKATPLLVPLVEEGLLKKEILTPVLENYLADLKQENIDVLILGCTHYPILKSAIQDYFGESVELVDSAVVMSQAVRKFLTDHKAASSKATSRKIFVTDSAERVAQIASRILAQDRIPEIQLIKL